MLFVSVTRLRLRSFRFFVPFMADAFRTRRQVARAPGFRGGSLLADGVRTCWTMTAWDNQESMRSYITTGSHRSAMPRLLDWCDEASVVHWSQPEPELPSWPEAGKTMREKGRPAKVRHPSPQHATLNFETPRTSAASPIRPVILSER